MGCSFRPDWVAGFLRMRWQLCTGLGGRNHRNTHLSIRLGQNGPHTLRRASSHGKSVCASLLRPTPARDDGGEHPCRASLPCIGIL